MDIKNGIASSGTKRMMSVLVVDDESETRDFLYSGLARRFGLVETAVDISSADDLCQRCHFDLIIADIRPSGGNGLEWVAELRKQGSTTGVILMAKNADLDIAIAALRANAEDLIIKPFQIEQMMATIERYIERQHCLQESREARRKVVNIFDGSRMVGNSEQVQNLNEIIQRVAPMPSTVLIEGESGTGKELAARAIHDWSGRAGSFVPINCGAMTAELMESELFGHVKGAFTGAHQAREGLFNFASKGTLFLDEIGEMPLSMQAHLLRVLEERTIRPVGSNQETPVEVRIVAATNRDLKMLVQEGRFRKDLYYRLNVLSIHMPALRERMDDIPVLARHFIRMLAADLGVAEPLLGEDELNRLSSYEWPGNVRELKNVIERCLLLGHSPSACMAGRVTKVESTTDDQPSDLLLESVEKNHIFKVLELENGNKSAAARYLGISRKTLERKVRAWGLGAG